MNWVSYPAALLRFNIPIQCFKNIPRSSAPWVFDSKTLTLYGWVNQDNRRCFKIDHDFDLSRIIDGEINPQDGSILIDGQLYSQSEGREFIIIDLSDVKGARFFGYAIRSDKYRVLRDEINKGELSVEDIENAGGYQIASTTTPDRAFSSDCWLELAVGKNNASEADYEEVSRFLKEEYALHFDQNIHRAGKNIAGPYFSFQISCPGSYRALPWRIYPGGIRVVVSDDTKFGSPGCFLRLCVEDADAQKKS